MCRGHNHPGGARRCNGQGTQNRAARRRELYAKKKGGDVRKYTRKDAGEPTPKPFDRRTVDPMSARSVEELYGPLGTGESRHPDMPWAKVKDGFITELAWDAEAERKRVHVAVNYGSDARDDAGRLDPFAFPQNRVNGLFDVVSRPLGDAWKVPENLLRTDGTINPDPPAESLPMANGHRAQYLANLAPGKVKRFPTPLAKRRDNPAAPFKPEAVNPVTAKPAEMYGGAWSGPGGVTPHRTHPWLYSEHGYITHMSMEPETDRAQYHASHRIGPEGRDENGAIDLQRFPQNFRAQVDRPRPTHHQVPRDLILVDGSVDEEVAAKLRATGKNVDVFIELARSHFAPDTRPYPKPRK